jgi:hypothetical protein
MAGYPESEKGRIREAVLTEAQIILSAGCVLVALWVWWEQRPRVQSFLMLVFGGLITLRLGLFGLHYLSIVVGFWTVVSALLRMFHLPLIGDSRARSSKSIGRSALASLLVLCWLGALILLLGRDGPQGEVSVPSTDSVPDLAGVDAKVWMALVFLLFATFNKRGSNI